MLPVLGIVGLIVLGIILVLVIIQFRTVVPTNCVHIVQRRDSTVSFGKDTENGNVYYEWPSVIPFFGITKIVLPVSVFDLDLANYEAYDKGRLPFVVDIKAFFRINESNLAAQRVSSFEELKEQLIALVQGAVRAILASSEIEEIMQGRSKFGEMFTGEVNEQLANWGVVTVKNIELMDIRDGRESRVIKDIMEKKKSLIESESRQEIAKNRRVAEIAEIEANKDVNLQTEEAARLVQMKKVEVRQQVSLADQEAIQRIKEKEKITKEKEMEVAQVENVRKAEIAKSVQVVKAQEMKETQILIAEGKFETERREADATKVKGEAQADAKRALELAPIQAQIELAKEIGNNESYQKYLIGLEQIKASETIGVAQAKALEAADIKIIANSDSASTGLNGLGELISSKGGTQLGAMVEGLLQSEAVKGLLGKDEDVVVPPSTPSRPSRQGAFN